MNNSNVQPNEDRIKFKKLVANASEGLEGLAKELSGEMGNYELQTILFELLKRVALNVSAINQITDRFISNSNFKFSIYILLRTLIADAIIAVYLVDADDPNAPIDITNYQDTPEAGKIMFSNEEIKRFNERYELLNREALRKIEKRLTKLLEVQAIDSKRRGELVKGWQNSFPSSFDNDGKIKKNKHSGVEPKVKEISNVHDKEFAEHIYSHYIYLSQYEHFSEATLTVAQSAVSDDIIRMTNCLWFILRGARAICIYLNQTTSDLDKLIEQSQTIFEDLHDPTAA